MYSSEIRNDYTLTDAFHALGVRLYGPQWTGYEIWRHKVVDPTPDVKARASITLELEQILTEISKKQNEQKDVVLSDDLSRVNDEIRALNRERDDLFFQFHQIKNVSASDVEDHEKWKRFEYAEGVVLRALRNGEIHVYGPSTFRVKEYLWKEMPEGFGYDWELSLIYWPSSECARVMDTARITQNQFENWLETVVPVIPHDEATITTEHKAQIRLKELVQAWDGRMKRDQFKEILQDEYSDLGERAFKRIWDAEATRYMKTPGAKKAT